MTVVLSVGTRCQSDARDIAAVLGSPRQPGEIVAPEVVDRAGPLRFFHRPFAQVDLVTQQDAACTDFAQVALLANLGP